MDRSQDTVKFSLVINIVLVTFQFLAIVWMLGPFCGQFKSIFESMNVQLPTVTSMLLSTSSLMDGVFGWIMIILVLLAGLGSAYKVLKVQQIYVVLPIINALQSLAFLLGFFVFIWIFVPMLTLVSGVG